jgi:hypothetical protein
VGQGAHLEDDLPRIALSLWIDSRQSISLLMLCGCFLLIWKADFHRNSQPEIGCAACTSPFCG